MSPGLRRPLQWRLAGLLPPLHRKVHPRPSPANPFTNANRLHALVRRLLLAPGEIAPGVSFGVAAANSLAKGDVDAFWANGMGAETAVRAGTGKVLVDIRRGDEPTKAFNYTCPALIGSDALIERDPDAAAATVVAADLS